MKDGMIGRLMPPVLFLVMVMILLGVFSQPAVAGSRIYMRVDSFSYSEPVSIHAAINSWRGNYSGGQQQSTWNWFELGVRFDRWGVGLLYRFDMALDFSPDTADLYYASENRLANEPRRIYRLDLHALRYSATGVRLRMDQSLNQQLHLQWGLSLFHADDLVDGRLQGSSHTAVIDYFYSKDELFERSVPRPIGVGTSVDLNLRWLSNTGFRLNAWMTDLLGYIDWNKAPFTRATASSDREVIEENGTLSLQPLVSGTMGTKPDFVQRLRPRLQLSLSQQIAAGINGLFEYRYQRGHSFVGPGVSWQRGNSELGTRYWPGIDSIELFVQRPGWRLSLAMDMLSRHDARALWFRFVLN